MMDRIIVQGGAELHGEIPIAGAKNACLALMPATLLTEEPLTLSNVPRLSDVGTMTALLRSLGVEVTQLADGRVQIMSSHVVTGQRADYDIVRKMRASNLVLGPLLARCGEAVLSLPGGCNIGTRPMALHFAGLERMGAEFDLRGGYYHGRAPKGLRGAAIDLDFPSVGATENLLMAATLAKGTTVINNAAREPEIADLAVCLRRMGAQIEGEGTASITISGVDRLHGATHPVIADRIELGTYMLAPAICGGSVECIGGRLDLIGAFAEKLDEAQQLADWITSEAGQQALTEVKTYFLPVRGDVSAGEGVPSLDSIALISYDPAFASDNRERLVDRWAEEVLGQ